MFSEEIPGVVDSPTESEHSAGFEFVPSSQLSEVRFSDEDIPKDVLSASDQVNPGTEELQEILGASEFAGIEGQVRSLEELSGTSSF